MNKSIFDLLGLAFSAGGRAFDSYEVSESLLQLRNTVTTLAAPLSLSPSQFWDGNDGQWTSYILRLGAPQPQNIRVLPSTKSNFIWAIDQAGCPDEWYPSKDSVKDCGDSRGGFFQGNESVAWTEKSIYKFHIDEDLGYGQANGLFGFDEVGLDYLGAGGILNHQLIAATQYQWFWFGALPLNPRPVNTSDMNGVQTSFLQSLKDSNNISSLSWGYTAGAKYRSENFFGSLVLGGYDPARFNNESQITVPFNADGEKDLTIQVNSISTNVSSDSLTSEAMNLVIDSTIPYLYLPESSYQLFEKTFGLEWNETLELYLINETHYDKLVEQNAELTFNVGTTNTTNIVFPIAAFLLTASFPLLGDDNSTSYYFPIQQANDTETLTLGRAFLQEAYIVYDYERSIFTLAPCIWPSDTAASPPSAPTIIRSVNDTSSDDENNTNTNTNSGLSAGAIAGAAVGGIVAGLLLAALIACIWLRRRRERKRRAASHSSRHFSASSTAKSPRSASAPHTRTSSAATTLSTLSPGGGRPRSGSRLASFFRNPWGSLSPDGGGPEGQVVPGRHELPVDPKAMTPAEHDAAVREREHKRHLSNELDAEVCAVHEMYQPKAVVPEMPGDGPLPTYASGDGATIEGNVLRAAEEERDGLGLRGSGGRRVGDEERRRLLEDAGGGRPGVYEMDATALSGRALSPMPSPGQLDAVARKELAERERLEAERAEAERVRVRELERRVMGGGGGGGGDDEGDGGDTIESLGGVSRSSTTATAVDRPDTERRVSDLSPISENNGFVMRSPTSPSRPDSGSRRVSRY